MTALRLFPHSLGVLLAAGLLAPAAGAAGKAPPPLIYVCKYVLKGDMSGEQRCHQTVVDSHKGHNQVTMQGTMCLTNLELI